MQRDHMIVNVVRLALLTNAGDANGLRELLGSHPIADRDEGSLRDAFLTAAKQSDVQVVQVILDAGRPSENMLHEAFHAACNAGSVEVIERICQIDHLLSDFEVEARTIPKLEFGTCCRF